ncbi:MAG: nitroreductase family protein [Clostridia bacterium]|nr:nitroreductase family protein [Clostridia bacterium]MBR1685848.1 nitroreductase family protein [Clostridia bacterium]MBR2286819.1 nitroreductase family protein [Clostridia bacterium]
MSFMDLLRRRASIRHYAAEPVPADKLEKILEAGLLTPSSRNLRPVRLIAVTDADAVHALAECKTAGAGMLREATCAIVVLGDSKLSDAWIEDTSLSLFSMQLMATELGVENCWVQCRARQAATESSDAFLHTLLDLPDNLSVEAVLALGMSTGEEKKTKDVPSLHEGQVFLGKYGVRY